MATVGAGGNCVVMVRPAVPTRECRWAAGIGGASGFAIVLAGRLVGFVQGAGRERVMAAGADWDGRAWPPWCGRHVNVELKGGVFRRVVMRNGNMVAGHIHCSPVVD
jgi:hypothetical protein